MDYLSTLGNSPPIQSAIQTIQRCLPMTVSHKLEDFYRRSSRNELIFIGAATFISLYNLAAYIKAKRQKLKLPPTIPYGLPFLGHTLYLTLMPNKFIDWCNKHYGEIYNISVLGRYITVTNGKCAEEFMKAEINDLSMEEGNVKDMLYLHYVMDEQFLSDSRVILPAAAKVAISQKKMPYYIPGIEKGLKTAIHKCFNQNEPTIVKDPSHFVQNLVAYMGVPTLIGKEVGENEEVIHSFAKFTDDIVGNIKYWAIIPNFLHPYFKPFIQSGSQHKETMKKHISKVIDDRQAKMRIAKEAGQDHGLDENLLQSLMEYTEGIDENTGEPLYLSKKRLYEAVLSIAFASVHTTTLNLSYCIYWLIARPDLKERLVEEIKTYLPGDTPFSWEIMQEMKFLNNFIREVLRQGVGFVAHGKKAMVDYTFYNGYQVPKGTTIDCTMRQMNFGSSTNRSTVDTMDPEASLNKQSSTPSKDFVSFGLGKHICPGRFFAVLEISMTLVYILKSFDVNTLNGKRPYPVKNFAGIHVSYCKDPLVFTPRKTKL
ncbi:cytochrome P450 [Cokeromyces recurvatus]|uniref:cytochrome P450 n=1 Tax=Cokeromyces recurvatus TaxID=90255 RepID=UPI0022200C0F|nr:cytochrome P450 [Cokeromyces recurvatus]KAI7897760.1 cytochrome P450 [Cokeromyces recurvatus]